MTSLRRLAVAGSIAAEVAMLATLTACAGVPDYKRPEVALPANWQPAAPFQTAQPNDAALKGNWWELFRDAQLNQLEQQALLHNQSLLSARAHLEQARTQVRVSSAALLPQATVQLGAARQKISADRPVTAYGSTNQSTVQNNAQLGFSVNYEADLFGRVRSNVASAQAFAQQAGADFENARLVLQADLAANYFKLRESDAEIDVVRQGIGLQEKAFAYVSARHELGVASGLDLAQQQAVLDTSKTALELLQNQRAQSVHALATLTGTAAPGFALPPSPETVSTTLAPPPVPNGVPSDVLQRRPDVASFERAVASANANIGVARAGYFPSIILGASGGWDSNQISNLLNAPSLLWSLGGAVTQTLFDAGKTSATLDIARASYNAAVANYRQSVLLAMQEVADGIDGMQILERAKQQAEASVRSSQRVLELANERYNGGVESYLDVITAQQTLLGNQRQAVAIRGQQMLTSVFLIKALGGGWGGSSAYSK